MRIRLDLDVRQGRRGGGGGPARTFCIMAVTAAAILGGEALMARFDVPTWHGHATEAAADGAGPCADAGCIERLQMRLYARQERNNAQLADMVRVTGKGTDGRGTDDSAAATKAADLRTGGLDREITDRINAIQLAVLEGLRLGTGRLAGTGAGASETAR